MTNNNQSFSIIERGKIVGLEDKSKTRTFHFGDLMLIEFAKTSDGKYTTLKTAAENLVEKQKMLLLKYFKIELDKIQKNFEIGIFTEDQYNEILKNVNLARGDLIGNSGNLAYRTVVHCVKEDILTDHLVVKVINKKFFDDFQNNLLELRRFEKEQKEYVEKNKRKLTRDLNFIIENQNNLVNKYGLDDINNIKRLVNNWLMRCSNLPSFFASENTDQITKIFNKVNKYKIFLETSEDYETVDKTVIKRTTHQVERQHKETARLEKNKNFLNNIRINYKVEHLYHFTSESNLPLIRKYGLLGWETLQNPPYNLKEGADFIASSNDLSRYLDKVEDYTDHIRLCKSKDHEMISAARHRVPDLVFLKINLEILIDSNIHCQYANDNATATSRNPIIDNDYKTFFESESGQAEILVTRHIPVQYIIGKEN